MSTSTSSLVRVIGISQQYEWGKVGSASAVARLQRDGIGATIDESKPYAELWMGTHASGPSSVCLPCGTQKGLREHLGHDLPFLFKVLSVEKALSIQAHPNKHLAQQLNATRPNVYKDPCHKPELACALTPFEALCSFRPLAEIRDNARANPELRALMGEDNFQRLEKLNVDTDGPATPEQKSVLKSVFSALMTPTPELLQTNLDALLSRLQSQGVQPSVPRSKQTATPKPCATNATTAESLDVPSLVLRLSQQYPGDVGIFAPFFLNALVLQPGQALFLGPDEPHAYLSGDCIECMACSDNVVRAGLTPKLRDTDVLIDMLTYEPRNIAGTLMRSQTVNGAPDTLEFAPPAEFTEFRLLQTVIAAGASSVLPVIAGPSKLILFEGAATLELTGGNTLEVTPGQIVLVPDQAKVSIRSTSDSKTVIFQCAANNK